MDLKTKINLLRERLNQLVIKNDEEITSKEIIELSQELDLLVKDWQIRNRS
jgi:hypothetical protein